MQSDAGIFFDYDYIPCDHDGDFDWHFKLAVKPCNKTPDNWGQECLNTAQYIRDNSDRPLMVALSGGIDSEVICRSFIHLGIPFDVFTLRYLDYDNHYDTVWADNFCQQYNLKQHTFQIDFEKLYTMETEKYINQGYQAVNLFRYFQLWTIDKINSLGYTAILGSGEQKFKHKHGQTGLAFDPGFLNALDYGRTTGAQHFPYFFMTRPELVAAYLNESVVTQTLADLKETSLAISHETKKQVYKKYFPELVDRPKFSGMDQIHGRRLELQDQLVDRFPELRKKFVSVSYLKQQLSS
jgi:hypothetical protein